VVRIFDAAPPSQRSNIKVFIWNVDREPSGNHEVQRKRVQRIISHFSCLIYVFFFCCCLFQFMQPNDLASQFSTIEVHTSGHSTAELERTLPFEVIDTFEKTIVAKSKQVWVRHTNYFFCFVLIVLHKVPSTQESCVLLSVRRKCWTLWIFWKLVRRPVADTLFSLRMSES
jgi:hypothetical protein